MIYKIIGKLIIKLIIKSNIELKQTNSNGENVEEKLLNPMLFFFSKIEVQNKPKGGAFHESLENTISHFFFFTH